jgi:hypothetical protein
MTVGMVPMALALEKGSQMQAPLGLAVIGGLVMSTVATLLVLPSVFAVVIGGKLAHSPSIYPDDPKSLHYDPQVYAPVDENTREAAPGDDDADWDVSGATEVNGAGKEARPAAGQLTAPPPQRAGSLAPAPAEAAPPHEITLTPVQAGSPGPHPDGSSSRAPPDGNGQGADGKGPNASG